LNLPNLFTIAGLLTEAVVIGLLHYRRIWRNLPVFFIYCLWALFSDSIALAITLASPKGYDLKFYFATTIIDFVMQFCVIVELAWSVLRPVRRGLSPHAIWAVAVLILGIGAVIWPFASATGIAVQSKTWHITFQLQQTVSILRVVFFIGLAACSQMLGLGWRDRELQVATGFGFYSLVSLVVAAVNARLATGSQYKQLYWVVAFSFLGSLVYWVFSFAQKEAERREFSPQAKEILMAVARSAHMTRSHLDDLAAARSDGH
jgi:hypothetical protein